MPWESGVVAELPGAGGAGLFRCLRMIDLVVLGVVEGVERPEPPELADDLRPPDSVPNISDSLRLPKLNFL